MLNTFKRRVSAISLMAFMALTMALPAFATPPTGPEAVNTAVTSAADDASSIVTTGIPIILAVAALWVALKFGKRLLAKI